MMKRLSQSAWAAWAMVIAWGALVAFLMLAPGEDSVVEDTSRFFGGTELTDALGHVVLFGTLSALLARALGFSMPASRALRLGAGSVIALGTLLEFGQLFAIERGASLLDLSANWIGPLLAAVWGGRAGIAEQDERSVRR